MMLNDPGGDTIRVHVGRSLPLPDPSLYLHPPCFDTDGNPVFFGSANLNKTVQPCKVTLKDNELICSIPHRLVEHVHMGSFNILPFAENMELVPTSYGRIPPGYHPVVGGVDENGRPLYHAVTWVHQVRVPGRTSKQLGAAAVLFGGREHYVYHAHEILCWHDNNESNCDLPSGSHPVEHSSSGNQRHETPLKETSGILEPGEKDPAGMNIRVTVSDLSAVSHPAATDFDGVTPLYFGSAVMLESILPAKVIETRVCQALQDDIVVERSVGFSILPFDADMELVPASYGAIPRGRRPVQGNYDAQGRKLYHAMIYVLGRKIPGMCGEQLVSASHCEYRVP
ncbi:hypothetical protein BS17DRAFT_581739 [Gyrodon lividus]|nr:hypothetical protein BS17DRAFT_581739 [Gyrodon lividus]